MAIPAAAFHWEGHSANSSAYVCIWFYFQQAFILSRDMEGSSSSQDWGWSNSCSMISVSSTQCIIDSTGEFHWSPMKHLKKLSPVLECDQTMVYVNFFGLRNTSVDVSTIIYVYMIYMHEPFAGGSMSLQLAECQSVPMIWRSWPARKLMNRSPAHNQLGWLEEKEVVECDQTCVNFFRLRNTVVTKIIGNPEFSLQTRLIG